MRSLKGNLVWLLFISILGTLSVENLSLKATRNSLLISNSTPLKSMGKLKVELGVVNFFQIDTEELSTMCAKFNFSNCECISFNCPQFKLMAQLSMQKFLEILLYHIYGLIASLELHTHQLQIHSNILRKVSSKTFKPCKLPILTSQLDPVCQATLVFVCKIFVKVESLWMKKKIYQKIGEKNI